MHVIPPDEQGQDLAKRRIPGIDGVRGFAILQVLLYHYFCTPLLESNVKWAVVAGKAMQLGWSGVDLFFVLSGFLIGGILLDQKGADNYYRVFFLRRACRILPLYLLVLLLYAFFGHYNSNGPNENNIPFWSYFVFLQNFCMVAQHSFGNYWLGSTWSLAVEEQFYLILPFMVRGLSLKTLVRISALGILGALVLRMVVRRDVVDYILPFTRADSVLAGLLLACALRHAPSRAWLAAERQTILMATALGFAGMILLTWKSQLLGDAMHSLIAFFYTCCLCLLLLGPNTWLGRAAASRVFVFFGTISYGIYLLHMPVTEVVHWLQSQKILPSGIFTHRAISLAVVMTASTLSHYFIERWFVAFGHRFKYQRHGNES